MATERVMFRKWKGNGAIIAFFPDQPDGPYLMSYAHIGQHSEASLEYYWSTRKVDYDSTEVKALVNELCSIGYNVRLMKRLARPFGGWAK